MFSDCHSLRLVLLVSFHCSYSLHSSLALNYELMCDKSSVVMVDGYCSVLLLFSLIYLFVFWVCLFNHLDCELS